MEKDSGLEDSSENRNIFPEFLEYLETFRRRSGCKTSTLTNEKSSENKNFPTIFMS